MIRKKIEVGEGVPKKFEGTGQLTSINSHHSIAELSSPARIHSIPHQSALDTRLDSPPLSTSNFRSLSTNSYTGSRTLLEGSGAVSIATGYLGELTQTAHYLSSVVDGSVVRARFR